MAEKSQRAPPTLGELTLVCPASEIARVACDEIVEDLKIVGVACTLRPLEPGQSHPADDDWDLVYLEYVMPEPLVDARRLLAADAFVASPNPHLNLALRQLDQAVSWNQAGERLRTIHQLCYDDTTVIPLWQIVEHLAHRPGISGLVPQPVETYQDLEAWRLQPE